MFSKSDDGRLCSWRAELPRHRRLQGSTMAARSGHTDLPHDLAQFVVEATLGLEEGFWNLVANGATFKGLGWRPTRPGRRLIAEHRAGLNEAERVVNVHVAAWRDGDPTPVGPALRAMLARWRALPPDAELVVDWPTRRLPTPHRACGAPHRSGVPGGPSGPELALAALRPGLSGYSTLA
jgi:hypothetical protein